MTIVCRHKYAPLTTVLLFSDRQASLEQCTKCEKLRGRYHGAVSDGSEAED